MNSSPSNTSRLCSVHTPLRPEHHLGYSVMPHHSKPWSSHHHQGQRRMSDLSEWVVAPRNGVSMQVGQLQVYLSGGDLDEASCELFADLAAMGGRLDRKQNSQLDGILEAMTYDRMPLGGADTFYTNRSARQPMPRLSNGLPCASMNGIGHVHAELAVECILILPFLPAVPSAKRIKQTDILHNICHEECCIRSTSMCSSVSCHIYAEDPHDQ